MNVHCCLVALVLFFGLQSGCATIQPGLRAKTFNNGTPDPDRDEQVELQAKTLKEVPDVQIFAGQLPAGLDLTEGGTKITVAEGYSGQYEILGTVESDYTQALRGAIWKNIYWTWNYDEGWRKGLCWPQAPLKAVTLGLWNLLPWAWPCMATVPSEEKDRQKAHLGQLKKLAAAMGGNMVVISNSGDLAVTTVTNTGAVVGHSVTKNMLLKGFAIHRAKEARTARQVPAGD